MVNRPNGAIVRKDSEAEVEYFAAGTLADC